MRTLAAEFIQRASNRADEIAVVDASGVRTTADVASAAMALASELAELFTREGTILLQADNNWRTLAATVAVGLHGGVVVMVSRHATASEVAMVCEDVRPDGVVAEAEVLTSWGIGDQGLEDSHSVLTGWLLRPLSGDADGVARWRGGSVIAMTSGSTGRPKCVVQAEEALRYADRSTIAAVGLAPGDSVAALVPLSSMAAFCFGMYLPAMLGGPMVCLSRWNPAEALALVRTHEVRWTMLVPTMALQLSLTDGADGAMASSRAMTVGGGPMDAGALRRAEEILGTRILRVFGMSECLGHTTPTVSDPPEVRLGRDGRPFPGTRLRVVDESGSTLSLEEPGKLQVRGPSLFVGYARNGAPQPQELTSDGFFTTGDLARLHHDGTLTIVGREKQVIIRGGRNLDVNEVEAAVAGMDAVVDVCVVPVPDEILGERAAALVVCSSPISLADVTSYLEKRGLAKTKWPEFVYKVPTLPQNRVGKLSREAAVAMAAELRCADRTTD